MFPFKDQKEEHMLPEVKISPKNTHPYFLYCNGVSQSSFEIYCFQK